MIVGQHRELARGIPQDSEVIGGCQIIRLFHEVSNKFLLFIGGKSEAFSRPLSSSVQEQLAEKLLREKGDIQQKHTDFRFSSVINSFVHPPIEYSLDSNQGLTSQVYSSTK